MRSRIYILGLVFLIILVAVGSCRKAGSWLVKDDQLEHADVMVLLMGSLSERVLQTADLYHEKVASRVWIVEAGTGQDSILEKRGVKLISHSMRTRNVLVELGIPADSIVLLPGGATSTKMEARIVRDYLRTQDNINTILLVSSTEHTQRAYNLFNAALSPIRESGEKPVDVYCSSSIYSSFHPERWWRSRDNIEIVVREHLKMINFFLFEKRELKKERTPQRSAPEPILTN